MGTKPITLQQRTDPPPAMPRLAFFLLVVLPALAVLVVELYISSTSHAALGEELNQTIGPMGSHVTPWLYNLSPDLARCIGSILHARQQWGWSWPAAVIYGFPGLVIVVLAVAAWLGLLVWQRISRWRTGNDTDPEDGAGN